jgi:hypothetical protein
MNMLTIAEKMLEENDLYVLATCADNLPNSSLMHNIYDEKVRAFLCSP